MQILIDKDSLNICGHAHVASKLPRKLSELDHLWSELSVTDLITCVSGIAFRVPGIRGYTLKTVSRMLDELGAPLGAMDLALGRTVHNVKCELLEVIGQAQALLVLRKLGHDELRSKVYGAISRGCWSFCSGLPEGE